MAQDVVLSSEAVPICVSGPECPFADFNPPGLANYSFYFVHRIYPFRLEKSREAVRHRYRDVLNGFEPLLDDRHLFSVVLVCEIDDDLVPHSGHVDGQQPYDGIPGE